VTAKQAHPHFLQLIRASPAVNMRITGGLNKSAAPLHLPSLGYHWAQLPGHNKDVTAALHAIFMDGVSQLDWARALQADPRQCKAFLHHRLLLSALEPSLGG